MTLDEAIKHAEEKAKEQKKNAEHLAKYGFSFLPKEEVIKTGAQCLQCANDHEQLAKWLRELKSYKDKNNEILEYMKTSLSQSDELKEKHRNIDGDHHKRMAIIFEGMGEAYADLIDRFFKEETT